MLPFICSPLTCLISSSPVRRVRISSPSSSIPTTVLNQRESSSLCDQNSKAARFVCLSQSASNPLTQLPIAHGEKQRNPPLLPLRWFAECALNTFLTPSPWPVQTRRRVREDLLFKSEDGRSVPSSAPRGGRTVSHRSDCADSRPQPIGERLLSSRQVPFVVFLPLLKSDFVRLNYPWLPPIRTDLTGPYGPVRIRTIPTGLVVTVLTSRSSIQVFSPNFKDVEISVGRPEQYQSAALTPDQAHAMLGGNQVISRASFYAGISRGDIPSRRIGRRILIPRHAFLTWLHAGMDVQEI